ALAVRGARRRRGARPVPARRAHRVRARLLPRVEPLARGAARRRPGTGGRSGDCGQLIAGIGTAMRALLALLRGPNGHPVHPPFTDATIGAYTVASILGILAVAGVSTGRTTSAWWLALLVGLCLTVP